MQVGRCESNVGCYIPRVSENSNRVNGKPLRPFVSLGLEPTEDAGGSRGMNGLYLGQSNKPLFEGNRAGPFSLGTVTPRNPTFWL